jgi:hypothetical protein
MAPTPGEARGPLARLRRHALPWSVGCLVGERPEHVGRPAAMPSPPRRIPQAALSPLTPARQTTGVASTGRGHLDGLGHLVGDCAAQRGPVRVGELRHRKPVADPPERGRRPYRPITTTRADQLVGVDEPPNRRRCDGAGAHAGLPKRVGPGGPSPWGGGALFPRRRKASHHGRGGSRSRAARRAVAQRRAAPLTVRSAVVSQGPPGPAEGGPSGQFHGPRGLER